MNGKCRACPVYLRRRRRAGGWFNIKTASYQHRKSHCGDKTILRPSYLQNGISYTGKMTSLYWIRAQDIICACGRSNEGGANVCAQAGVFEVLEKVFCIDLVQKFGISVNWRFRFCQVLVVVGPLSNHPVWFYDQDVIYPNGIGLDRCSLLLTDQLMV